MLFRDVQKMKIKMTMMMAVVVVVLVVGNLAVVVRVLGSKRSRFELIVRNDCEYDYHEAKMIPRS